MLFQSTVLSAIAALSATVMSQSTSSSTSSSQVQVQVIQVSNSNGSLEYFPNNIQAAVGTMVQFQFHPKNHTVTQASFAEPCTPLLQSTPNATSMFKSGFMPVAADATELPVFTIQINNTKPIWAYCSQTGHCEKGMVLAINANNSSPNSFAAFQASALALATNSSSSSTGSSSGSAASSSASGTSSSSTSTTSNSPAQVTTSGASRSVVGVTGLALFFVAGLALVL